MTEPRGEWPPLIDVGRVLELHTAALAHAGGAAGVREMGLVESAVSAAWTAAFYTSEGDEIDPLTLAAHLLFYLAMNHAFVDGNKRVAWLAMEEQLRLVRVRVYATPSDAEQMVLGVVEKRLEPADIISWIASHLDSDDL